MPLDPSLPQLRFGGKYLLPQRDSYQYTTSAGTRRTDTPGGPMFVQQDHLGGPFITSVTYFIDSPQMYAFFSNFYQRQTLQGSIPFQAALILQDAEIYEDYVCRFKDEPQFQWTGFRGTVTFTIEVERRASDFEYDDTLFWFLQEYGDDAWPVLNELYILTNPTMDTWIPDV